MKIHLVDGRAAPFRPLSWTRPLCELLFGAETFRERFERLSGTTVAGVFSHGRFEELPFARLGGAALRVNAGPTEGEPLLLLDSLYVPTSGRDPAFADRGAAARFWAGGSLAGAWLTAKEARPVLQAIEAREDWRAAVRGGEDVELPGRRPAALHVLVAENAAQIVADLGQVAEEGGDGDRPGVAAQDRPQPVGASDSSLVQIEGPRGRLRIHAGAEIAGPIHVDVRNGPIRVDTDVRVEPFTVLRGPLVVRSGCRLLGGEVGAGTTLGPGCRVRGEVQNSVFLGLSNKAHDGYVGDSYLGEWVNLGAGTTTSNLKNNYGQVRLRLADEVVETGLLKLGSLIGDHVKTGIGTLLPTGAWVGPGTNLYGTRGQVPAFVPPFSWGAGTRQETHRLEAFLESARRVMERRGLLLEAEEAGMLGAVFRATEQDRITA